jgi:AcrR family transcriptional regulator
MFAMAHPPYLREKARELRRTKHLTIDELAARLALPRTTIYHWVRDLPVPASGPGGGLPTWGQRLGTAAMQQKYLRLRESAYEEGRHSFDTLAADGTFRDFVCLYVAEGYKRSRNTVAICNSNPPVMNLADRWMRRLTQSTLAYSIQYHTDQDLEELRAFWGTMLGVEAERIRMQRKSNSNQLSGRTWRCEYGVLQVAAYDTLFRARMQAWMDHLRSSWS